MRSILDRYRVDLVDLWQRNFHTCEVCGILGPKYRMTPKSIKSGRVFYICNTCYFNKIISTASSKTTDKKGEKITMEEKNLTTYFVSETTPSENLRTALGRMIEYAKFLEKESGREQENFVDTILDEEDIEVTTECPTMLEKVEEKDHDELVNLVKEIFSIACNGTTLNVADIASIIKTYNIDLNSL